MKKLLPTLISVFALTVFAQSDKQKSRIPEWFMRPSADSYIGISAPNSSEQDAINMAILPLLMAHDSPAKCKEIIQSVYMESEDNLTSHTSGHYEIMIDTVVSYSIQNISKLESGEYICCLTNGENHKKAVRFMLEKALEESDNNADISSIEKTEFLCIMGEWKCIIKSYSSIEEFERHKEDNKKSFSFKYYSEYYDMSYSYTSPLFEDNSSNHYIFPLTKRPKHDEGATLSFSMNGNQSLFEQLLNAYWQIFYEGFSAIDSAYITQNDGMTIYDMRKATPLMGFSYDDGLFEIKYRK